LAGVLIDDVVTGDASGIIGKAAIGYCVNMEYGRIDMIVILILILILVNGCGVKERERRKKKKKAEAMAAMY